MSRGPWVGGIQRVERQRAADVVYYVQSPVEPKSQSNTTDKLCCYEHAYEFRQLRVAALDRGEQYYATDYPHRCEPGARQLVATTPIDTNPEGDGPNAASPAKARPTTIHEMIDRFVEVRARQKQRHAETGHVSAYRFKGRQASVEREGRRMKQYFAPDERLDDIEDDAVEIDYPIWLATSGALLDAEVARKNNQPAPDRTTSTEGLSSYTAKGHLDWAADLFEWGAQRRYVHSNPFANAEPIPAGYEGAKEKLRRLEDLVTVVRLLPRQWRCAGALLLFLALRAREGLGVRLCDIDLGRRMIMLRGLGGGNLDALDDFGNPIVVQWRPGLKGTKDLNNPITRLVPIPEKLAPIIEWQIRAFHPDVEEWAASEATLVQADGWQDSSTYNEFRAEFLKAVTLAGLDDKRSQRRHALTTHSLRKNLSTRLQHYAASSPMLLSPAAVSDFLGHVRMSDGAEASSEVTRTAYYLDDMTWDDVDPGGRGLSAIAAAIDTLWDKVIPAGLFGPESLDDETDWIGPNEVADILGVDQVTARTFMQQGDLAEFTVEEMSLPGRKYAGSLWVPRRHVLAFACDRDDTMLKTVAEQVLGRSKPTIRNLIAQGVLEEVKGVYGPGRVTQASVDAYRVVLNQQAFAKRHSVSFSEAARVLGTSKATIERRVASGELEALPGAPARTVSRESVKTYGARNNHDSVTAAYARQLLVLDESAFVQRISSGALVVTETGGITRLSLEAQLAKTYRPRVRLQANQPATPNGGRTDEEGAA